MTTSRKTWWYAIGQEKIGPCSGSELIELVAQGKLFPETLVWKQGMPNWVPASRIKGLWQNPPAVPPQQPLQSTTPPPFAAPVPASSPHADAFGTHGNNSASSQPQFSDSLSAQPDWGDEYEEEPQPPKPLTFKEAVVRCFKKYFVFSGRASRAEFWYFTAFIYGLAFLIGVVSGLMDVDDATLDSIIGIYQLALLAPSLAVGTRRLHDINRSGWWQLISLTGIGILLLIYWWIKKGDEGPNEYGYLE